MGTGNNQPCPSCKNKPIYLNIQTEKSEKYGLHIQTNTWCCKNKTIWIICGKLGTVRFILKFPLCLAPVKKLKSITRRRSYNFFLHRPRFYKRRMWIFLYCLFWVCFLRECGFLYCTFFAFFCFNVILLCKRLLKATINVFNIELSQIMIVVDKNHFYV